MFAVRFCCCFGEVPGLSHSGFLAVNQGRWNPFGLEGAGQDSKICAYMYVQCMYIMSCYFTLCHALPCYVMMRILCYAMSWCAMLCHALSCYAMFCHAMPCFGVLCHDVPCYVMLCRGMPCYVMPCHALPWYAMLWHATAMLRHAQTFSMNHVYIIFIKVLLSGTGKKPKLSCAALQILSVVASLALPDAAHREREGARDSRWFEARSKPLGSPGFMFSEGPM